MSDRAQEPDEAMSSSGGPAKGEVARNGAGPPQEDEGSGRAARRRPQSGPGFGPPGLIGTGEKAKDFKGKRWTTVCIWSIPLSSNT